MISGKIGYLYSYTIHYFKKKEDEPSEDSIIVKLQCLKEFLTNSPALSSLSNEIPSNLSVLSADLEQKEISVNDTEQTLSFYKFQLNSLIERMEAMFFKYLEKRSPLTDGEIALFDKVMPFDSQGSQKFAEECHKAVYNYLQGSDFFESLPVLYSQIFPEKNFDMISTDELLNFIDLVFIRAENPGIVKKIATMQPPEGGIKLFHAITLQVLLLKIMVEGNTLPSNTQ